MAINTENIDFLFDVMKFYDDQYNSIADSCASEVERALNEICDAYLKQQQITVLPFGSYAIKNNYQIIEPIEFYCILPSNRDVVLNKEAMQKKHTKKNKKTLKDIYGSILGTQDKDMTSIDVARTIMQELQKYIAVEDKVYFKNNVVFLKINMQDEDQTIITVIIHVVYDFENDGILEFSKMGYHRKEDSKKIIQNILKKNYETKGNYLLLCKLIKMLELELILANQSNIYLSKKTLFVENILYNVPNKFYQTDDFCEMFRNIETYLKSVNIQDIVLPDGTDSQMFEKNGYYANSECKSFLRKIAFLYKNTDGLIDDVLSAMQNSNEEMNNEEDAEKTQKSNSNENSSKEIKKINKIKK